MQDTWVRQTRGPSTDTSESQVGLSNPQALVLAQATWAPALSSQTHYIYMQTRLHGHTVCNTGYHMPTPGSIQAPYITLGTMSTPSIMNTAHLTAGALDTPGAMHNRGH